MQVKENQIIRDSLSLIDKKNFLLNLLQSRGLMKISSEILTVSPFAQSFLAPKEKSDVAMQFMICLDFLLKGVLIHW